MPPCKAGRVAKELKKLAYVIVYERLTGVDRDVERVIYIRQVTLPSDAVSVPQFKTAECRRVLLQAYLVNEHVWR